MRTAFAMREQWTYFGGYKMLGTLFQLALISATTAQSIACGGVFRGGGTISSPNYPNNYPNGSYCLWTLMATEGRQISLQMADLHLERDYDYVLIYKDKQMKVQSYNFTGSIRGNNERLILAPTITIVFSSDASHSDTGFLIKFESVDVALYTACGGEIRESGNITSPNYPQQYPNNSHCVWTLSTTGGRLVSLRLIRIDTESGFDYVRIYNGTNFTEPYLTDNLTGYYSTNPKRRLYGEAATIVFTSDNTKSTQGFVIEFKSSDMTPYTACGGELNGSGIITTPRYPQTYPDNTRCLWKIAASFDQQIYIQLLDINPEFPREFLIFNSRPPYYDRWAGKYNKNLWLEASSAPLYISFTSNRSYSDSGFRMRFNVALKICPKVPDCGGELQGSGNITFSNYQCSYATCTWTLRAASDHIISLQIADMSTDDGDMVIYNGTQLMQAHSYFRYTTSNWRTAKPILLGPTCTVVFRKTKPDDYLKLEFQSVSSGLFAACGGELNGSGNITSRDVRDFYPYNSHCIWRLAATTGHKIVIKVSGIESYPYSIRDYVTLYVFNESEPISSYTLYPYTIGYKEDDKLILPGPTAIVLIYGNFTTLLSKLQIVFQSSDITSYTACGGLIEGSGEIFSPNYPSNYPNNCRCTWRLRATAGLSVGLRAIRKNTEKIYDHVEVYKVTAPNESHSQVFRDYPDNDYSDNTYNYIKFYKHTWYGNSISSFVDLWEKPAVFGSDAVVTFTSDSTISESGFLLEFTSINTTHYEDCGGILRDSGYITSPHYPNHYPNGSRCEWHLIPTKGHTISLRFEDFNTELYMDHLFVFESTYPEFGYDVAFSGGKPSRYEGKTMELYRWGTVLFMSDLTNSAPGFRIEFASVDRRPFQDCGGTLQGSGEITSPNYPHQYNNNSLCTWNLIADAGRSVLLHILEFNTEHVFEEYVEIINSISHSRGYRYSGNYNTTVQNLKALIPVKLAKVIFTSDATISDTGFRIRFRSVDTTKYTDCGGELRGSGNITSPHYPSNYPNNCRCTWTVRADVNYTVSLRFIEFNTENGNDIVFVYNEGLSRFSNHSNNYTGKFDGRVELITLGQNVSIAFTSDSSESASGFVIEFRTAYTRNYAEMSISTTAQPGRSAGSCRKVRPNNTALISKDTSDKN